MITVSVCMIVKNEESVLDRCLQSLENIADEIIVVDTGSTDATKEIAYRYTDKVYDFTWVNDFSKARNFAFSKAAMDYIYSADADEVVDQENREKFLLLKQAMLPEIEIVQMYYLTDMKYNTTENYYRDLRPKLYKRIRTFQWIDPIHEMVNLTPVVYDSEIEILHLPVSNHQKRDFGIFENMIKNEMTMSDRLLKMYLRELYLSGEKEDLQKAKEFLEDRYELEIQKGKGGDDLAKMIAAVLCKLAYELQDGDTMLKIATQDIAFGAGAEVCMQLGNYFFFQREYQNALTWYQNATFSTESYLDVHSSGDEALLAIAKTLQKIDADNPAIEDYTEKAKEWNAKHEFMADSIE